MAARAEGDGTTGPLGGNEADWDEEGDGAEADGTADGPEVVAPVAGGAPLEHAAEPRIAKQPVIRTGHTRRVLPCRTIAPPLSHARGWQPPSGASLR